MCVRPLPSGGESVKSFSGIVKEAREISLGFKTAGQIERIHVKEGDPVREGQLIAELDDADYRLGVEALQAQADQLEDEVGRMKLLYEAKSVSENDYEKAVAGLRQLKAQLQLNQNKLDYTKLYAPLSGYIQSVNFEPAEMVDAGTPLVTLLDINRLEVELDIPVEVYQRKDRITGIEYTNGTSVPMKLKSLTPKADGTQLYRMCLAFEGKAPQKLTAGMNASITLRMASEGQDGTFTLPMHAVFKENGNTYVWTIGKDSLARKVQVALQGMDGNGQAVISSGLKGDEQVVRAGVNALQENEKVSITPQPAKTNVGGLL
ncbi:MAG TPA: efflux RND transporter periplasmic adaptor subunit [Candidatus Phocaeicola merdavium]|nr:efflux RND transporter periplasmic adaptor subunit [Candidatus Phocaeicola merdavium]